MVETHGSEGLEWFVLGADGEELGPFNFRVVRAKLRLGVFAADAFVWREGMPDWGAAADEKLFAACIGYRPLRQGAEHAGPEAGAADGAGLVEDTELVKKQLRRRGRAHLANSRRSAAASSGAIVAAVAAAERRWATVP